jgi:hypothetical protein
MYKIKYLNESCTKNHADHFGAGERFRICCMIITTLSVTKLYSVEDRMISEYDGMILTGEIEVLGVNLP